MCGRGKQGIYEKIRKNTGMKPTDAIRSFASVYKTKTEMAYQFGITRNSLYKLMRRFDL